MEIIQTILNALTNENEIMMNIISIPMTFIEVCLSFLLFSQILNISYTKKQAFLYVIIFSIIALASAYLIPSPYNTFLNIIAMPVLLYFILKTNSLKSIIAEVTFYFTIFCVTTFIMIIYKFIFHSNPNVLMNIPIHKLCYSTLVYITLFLIYKICKKLKLCITFFDKFDKYNYNILITNFIVGTLAIGIEAYTAYSYISFMPRHLIFMSMAILLFYFAISLYSLYRTSQLEKTKLLLSEEKMYNKTLNTLHDNIRGFKHNFNNIVQAIGGYLSTDNIDGLRTYYKDLLKECHLNNNLTLLNPELINNPAIYSILTDKLYQCEKDDIKLNLDVLTDLSNLNIKMYELTIILGILLDNAIEAAKKCDKKIVNITFRKDNKTNIDLIIIQNTYTNKDVNIDKIFEKGYTSKTNKDKENHGLGLWEVRKYLRKNTNLDLYTTKNENYFTQQFEIYN